MTRNSMILMQLLYDSEVTNLISAKTIKELLEIEEISGFMDYQGLYRTLEFLATLGYVGYGAKEGRSYTYFLNKKGINWVKVYVEVDEKYDE